MLLETVSIATALISVALLASCASPPPLPGEHAFPVQQIVENAICELRETFTKLSDQRRYKHFVAADWAGSIALTPKSDADLIGTFGLTGKSTPLSVPRFWNWAFSPLVSVEARGHSDANVYYAFHNSELLKPNRELDELCAERRDDYHNLSHYLGLYEWWERAIPDQHGPLAPLLPIVDKTSFTKQIVVKLSSGTSSLTYNVVPHTFTLGGSGYYQRDLQISFAFTPDPHPKGRLETLPKGDVLFKEKASARKGVSKDALIRLDAIQQENILRNLRIQP